MRIALFNVCYSPNLGDGMLSECLERELKNVIAGLEIVLLDLAGRRNYSRGSDRRKIILAILPRFPLALRQQIARVVLGRSFRRSTQSYWRQELRSVDAVILGGGNLFTDTDLNFPLKILAACQESGRAGHPFTVHAVGVSASWSAAGKALFRTALQSVQLVHASVRDDRSKENWHRLFGAAGIISPAVVRDPGLLASLYYPKGTQDPHEPRRIGIGLTHPAALRYHADEKVLGAAELVSWLKQVVHGFAMRGGRGIDLFTNGSPEDEAFLDEIGPQLIALARPGVVRRVSRFDTPASWRPLFRRWI